MKLATSLLFLAAGGANAFAPSPKAAAMVTKLSMAGDPNPPPFPTAAEPSKPTTPTTELSMSSAVAEEVEAAPVEAAPTPVEEVVAAPVQQQQQPAADAVVEMTQSGAGVMALEALAPRLNPIVPFWDPLGLVDIDFYGMGQDASVGFLRHAEIKHGRVAMAAFVGYCIQSNYHWPWAMMRDGTEFPSIDLSPEAQWDSIPEAAKWQMFSVIAFLEIWDEGAGGAAWGEGDSKMVHYTKGRQPGRYPSLQVFRDNVHPVLDLYDPFGLFKKMSAEKKEERLITEINNGRLAMIGIFAFMAADSVEGSVPALNSLAQPYDGQIMAPFSGQFSFFAAQ